MVAKTYIEKNLKTINRLYNKSVTIQEGLFYSKMAILELCGWTEVSMDDIALRTAKRIIRNSKHLKFFEKEVVRKVHGFNYEQHFRKMLMALIGLKGIEQMERSVDQSLFLSMCSALNALKPFRDKHAHEYIKGTTMQIDAPSLTMTRFYSTYKGLLDVEKVLKPMK